MQAKMRDYVVPHEIFSFQAMCPDQHEELYAFKASADPYTIYHREAMKEPDSGEFRTAMQMEIDAQIDEGVLELVRRVDAKNGVPILPAVCQMRRKGIS